jgi:hypothetical protein
MIGRLATAASTALLGSLAAVVLMALFYVTGPTLHLDFAVDPPRLMTGVHKAERDEATGLTFAWTSGDVALRVPGLDRRVPWILEVRLRGARENSADNPAVAFFVDGIRVATAQSETGFTATRLELPARPERPRGLLVTMQASSTFVPGPQDPRPLGVMLDFVTLSPQGIVLPPRSPFTTAATGGALFGAAIALMGVAPGLAIGAAVLVSAGLTATLARGFGPFTDYPETALRLTLAISIALAGIVLVLERGGRRPLRNTARFAVGFSAAALLLKLLVLLHPGMPTGDALFQAHRFQEVLRGNYYFTSIAPGNYLFPYAPGLYMAASPFADLVRREAGDVALLRIVVAVTDAVVAALLYLAVSRGWGDRRAGAMATAIYHLMPLDFRIATGGTLTSAFAQSLGVLSLVVMTLPSIGRSLQALGALMAVLLAASLSHTSTFAIVSTSTIIVAATIAWRGGLPLRPAAKAIALAGVTAALVAVAVYYAHFLDTYRTELSRITTETAHAAADAGGRSITDRALVVPYYLRQYFGIPVILLSLLGTRNLWNQQRRDQLTLTLAGSALTCLAFLAIGILTPVDMRYYVAALPVVAITAARGASHAWSQSPTHRAIAGGLLAWAIGYGIHTWWTTLM